MQRSTILSGFPTASFADANVAAGVANENESLAWALKAFVASFMIFAQSAGERTVSVWAGWIGSANKLGLGLFFFCCV